MVKKVAYAVLALPLAAFFAFVGWHKIFSSMADLAKYGAYTAHLPEWIGRAMGIGEVASALAVVIGIHPAWRRFVPMACGFIILSQILSSIIHMQHDEMAALPQNAVIAVMAAALVWLCRAARGRSASAVD